MAPRLTANVVVRNPDGIATCLEAGTELPAWAVGRVGKHVLDSGQQEPAAGAKPAEPSLNPPPPQPSGPVGTPPPKSGKGSTDAAWTKYASDNGVAVTEEMSRNEVIAACEAAGVPTD